MAARRTRRGAASRRTFNRSSGYARRTGRATSPRRRASGRSSGGRDIRIVIEQPRTEPTGLVPLENGTLARVRAPRKAMF